MTNPFQFFNASDDEQDNKVNVVKNEQKQKRTHQEKRLFKKQQEQGKNNNQPSQTAVFTEPLPEKTKQSHIFPHMERNKKEWKAKEVTSGHYHDRQSGTGRQDRPRKAGGGYGNVGNVKDEQNRQKYVKENEEVKPETTEAVTEQPQVPAAEEKAPEPPKLTLEEYYKTKGVDLTYTAQTKAPVKKGEVNAEWIKKEKLTLVQTKEELKNQERNGEQRVKFNSAKAGLDIDESDFGKLGFGSKPVPKEHNHHQKPEEHRKGGKKNKPLFSNDDFPTL